MKQVVWTSIPSIRTSKGQEQEHARCGAREGPSSTCTALEEALAVARFVNHENVFPMCHAGSCATHPAWIFTKIVPKVKIDRRRRCG